MGLFDKMISGVASAAKKVSDKISQYQETRETKTYTQENNKKAVKQEVKAEETLQYKETSNKVVVEKPVEYIKVYNFIDDLMFENYQTVKESLEAYGFTNISFIVKRDLKKNLKKGFFFGETNDYEDGQVESISINGEIEFNKKSQYLPTAKVVITYHTYQNSKPEENDSKYIKVSNFIYDIYEYNYKDAKKVLEAYGFTNISFIAIKDIKRREKKGLLSSLLEWHKDGEIEQISINGDIDFDDEDRFLPTDKVVISYHTYKDSFVENDGEKAVAKCPSCGATVEYSKSNPRCPYCEGLIKE